MTAKVTSTRFWDRYALSFQGDESLDVGARTDRLGTGKIKLERVGLCAIRAERLSIAWQQALRFSLYWRTQAASRSAAR